MSLNIGASVQLNTGMGKLSSSSDLIPSAAVGGAECEMRNLCLCLRMALHTHSPSANRHLQHCTRQAGYLFHLLYPCRLRQNDQAASPLVQSPPSCQFED